MDNQPPSPASAPVNPSGTAYIPPPTNPPTPPLPQVQQPNPTPPPLPPQKSRSWMLIIGMLLLLILIALGGSFYFLDMQKKQTEAQPVQTIKTLPTLVPSTPPTTSPLASPAATASISANSKVFQNSSYSFQYPQDFVINTETANKITMGEQADNGIIDYLTITANPTELTNYKQLKLCSQVNDEAVTPCIAEEGWQQKKPITPILIDGKDAVSFYLVRGVDNAFHIVQITDEPKIELKMNVAGGRLEQRFNNILSTFKFTQ